MHQISPQEAFETLSGLSSSQLCALAMPLEGLQFDTPELVSHRYVRGIRQPPAPPSGVVRQEDGSYHLVNLAVIRVQPDAPLRAAREVLASASRHTLLVGVGCGIVSAVTTLAVCYLLQRAPQAPKEVVAPPCMVASISTTKVRCKLADRQIDVAIGAKFPDARFQLVAVDHVNHGFVVTRTTDRRAFAFQVDPTFLNGVSKK